MNVVMECTAEYYRSPSDEDQMVGRDWPSFLESKVAAVTEQRRLVQAAYDRLSERDSTKADLRLALSRMDAQLEELRQEIRQQTSSWSPCLQPIWYDRRQSNHTTLLSTTHTTLSPVTADVTLQSSILRGRSSFLHRIFQRPAGGPLAGAGVVSVS